MEHDVWTQTHNGGRFDLLDPKPEQVIWDVVAHSLSLQCRFNGNTKVFYSVAEHSVHVLRLVASQTTSPIARLAALLHDAHEFALGDWTTPVVRALDRLHAVEHSWAVGPEQTRPGRLLGRLKTFADVAIFAAAGIPDMAAILPYAPLIKAADRTVLMAERKHVLGESPASWGDLEHVVVPADVQPEGWGSELAKANFLESLETLHWSNSSTPVPAETWSGRRG
jgi:uncharacterized protein